MFPLRESLNIEVMNKLYRNIVSFKTDPKYFFQQAAIAFMVHNIVKKEDLVEIRNLFLYLDQKGDGRLIYKEITNGFKQCKNYNEKDILRVVKFIDISKMGYIEYQEFVRACVDKVALLSEENMKNAFILFAKDENKEFILPSEFKSILGLQSKFSDSTWDEIIKAVDINGDNKIEYDEFKDMMLKFINEN
jgi:Ca2+-binding EF-hand superfamily protein